MKLLLTSLFLILFSIASFSQKNKIYSIDLYSSNKVAGITPIYIQGSFCFIQSLETGIYIGYSQTKSSSSFNNNFGEVYSTSNLFIGVLVRYYILKVENRVSPYVAGKAGILRNAIDYKTSADSTKTSSELGIYGGVKFNVYKPLSFFTEIGYSKFDLIRFGLSIKL